MQKKATCEGNQPTAVLWRRDKKLFNIASIETESLGIFGAEVIVPNDCHFESALVYLHGGAFVVGSPGLYRAFCCRLAQLTKFPVVVPDYRLAP